MTRIIAGSAGGRRLLSPPGSHTRPTSDRVREALFSRLEHLGALTGARVLDLYAGSGALGLEALSRGAAEAILVEKDARAAGTIRDNLRALALSGGQVRRAAVDRFLTAGPPPGWTADLVLADPPYPLTEPELAYTLGLLTGHHWLAERALLVVERSSRSPEPAWPTGIAGSGSRRHGETVLWFAEAVTDAEAAAPDQPAAGDA